MSAEFDFSTGLPSDEMKQYLQMYLDETAEQLDALVESLLVLEGHPTDAEQLNEAFRLIHSIKGSSAMMGLDGVTVLTHHLENHFERLRSGLRELDQSAMGLILRCIDFLRECNRRLRAGESLGSAPELLEELNTLSADSQDPHKISTGPVTSAVKSWPEQTTTGDTTALAPLAGELTPPQPETAAVSSERDFRVVVQFEAELALVDLKAELVLARLDAIATVRDTLPPRGEIGTVGELRAFQVLLSSDHSSTGIRAAADVDGVEFVEVVEGVAIFATTGSSAPAGAASGEVLAPDIEQVTVLAAGDVDAVEELAVVESLPVTAASDAPEARAKVAETVRVEIERLDNLMNLAGELVVNKARFVQIARQMSPAFKKSGRARTFSDSMRRALQLMKTGALDGESVRTGHWHKHFHEIESEIDALEEQARLWEESRRCFGQFTEAIDQMTRVSDSLQRGVLDTRMVPIGPLFNRFKRVVRDIAIELGKKVCLEIHGENTELDKRMIDELGDPLVHLIRNAIDHGIEPVEVRARRGKPEIGTIRLDATHSGNNVLISVRDDGAGINIDKVRRRIVERELATAAVADGLSDREIIEFIWNPGFSTADAVSDISGRGVGMDIVKTRISELNGTVDIENAAGRGTTFTIRLPLTLAIVRSLLFRLRHGIFAVPIENVREIVSVPFDQIVAIHGKQTFEVRGEFIPLLDVEDIFNWHTVKYQYPGSASDAVDTEASRVNVVILHAGDKTVGLKVEELQGGQDIVIKSLAENFVHIRGLSGASILGDGSVCLLFDVGAAIALAADRRRKEHRG